MVDVVGVEVNGVGELDVDMTVVVCVVVASSTVVGVVDVVVGVVNGAADVEVVKADVVSLAVGVVVGVEVNAAWDVVVVSEMLSDCRRTLLPWAGSG